MSRSSSNQPTDQTSFRPIFTRIQQLLRKPLQRAPHLFWLFVLVVWTVLSVVLGSCGTVVLLIYLLFAPSPPAPPTATPNPELNVQF